MEDESSTNRTRLVIAGMILLFVGTIWLEVTTVPIVRLIVIAGIGLLGLYKLLRSLLLILSKAKPGKWLWQSPVDQLLDGVWSLLFTGLLLASETGITEFRVPFFILLLCLTAIKIMLTMVRNRAGHSL